MIVLLTLFIRLLISPLTYTSYLSAAKMKVLRPEIEQLKAKYTSVSFHYFQSNIEGEIISELQKLGFSYDGIILNPAGYTHTSVAIGDAIAAIKTPVIEVHISNVHAREDFRKLSHVSGKSVGSIFGLGLRGYELALKWFVDRA